MQHHDASATQALIDLGTGDGSAAERLMPIVYDHLRAMASDYLKRERANHTLQPTALVHEAYLKLIDQTQVQFKSRAHFMAVAATAMRRILIDHARRHRAVKRSAEGARVSVEILDGSVDDSAIDIDCVDHVLTKLERTDRELYAIVEMRFFSGSNMQDIATALDLSLPTVERRWRLARAWLSNELSDVGGPAS